MSRPESPEELQERASTEPGFVKFTGEVTDTTDPEQAGRLADMLLLFLAAGGTVIGSLVGLGVYVGLTFHHPPTAAWIAALLGMVFLGGMVGCAVVMRSLHAKGMIVWEGKEPS